MTTPRPTPFPATTPRAGVLILFVIKSDSDDEITTLPIAFTITITTTTTTTTITTSSSSTPLPEHIKSVGDDKETLRASLASAMQETTTLHARVGLLKQHNMFTRDSLRITRGRITWSQLQAVYAKQETEHKARRTHMIEQGIATLRARAEAAEQRVETLQVSLGAARMDVKDLIESREADRIEMA
ncbi:hypothetical protein Tco_0749296 [Tanacetum coccineum]|uniref:Uncharacterized protein n=1 Tax=Tanacetum coccineum TaxID=301880 RepID=A0ABQ4YY83_9ASTR